MSAPHWTVEDAARAVTQQAEAIADAFWDAKQTCLDVRARMAERGLSFPERG